MRETLKQPEAITDDLVSKLQREMPEETSVIFGQIPVDAATVDSAIACAKDAVTFLNAMVAEGKA